MTPSQSMSPDSAPGTANVLVLSMVTALVMFAPVLWILGAVVQTPQVWMLVVVALATLGSWVLVALAPTPVSDGPPPLTVVTPAVVVRIALLEAPAIVGLILAFLSDPANLLIYLLPAALSLVGIWLFARPSVVAAKINRAA